jgi:hypothetical protein
MGTLLTAVVSWLVLGGGNSASFGFSTAADLRVLPSETLGSGGSLLRDRAELLFNALRGCGAGAWVDWTVVALAIERGIKPPVEFPRCLEVGEVDDTGERLARTFWVLFGGVRPCSI